MKVLIAVDGSQFSNWALQSVTSRQWTDDTDFMVLSVADSPYQEYGLYPPEEGIVDTIRQHLDRVVSSDVAILKSHFPKNSITGKVEQGNVKQTIVTIANDWGADLIVLGSHGRRGLSKFLLGSIAEGVLQLASCSVEIIRQKKSAQGESCGEDETAKTAPTP